MLAISRISPDELSPRHVAAWKEMIHSDVSLQNPFVYPEFVQAVAAVRGDVEIAVLQEGGQLIGFLPYQRVRNCHGQPVGGHLSNFQALIAYSSATLDVEQIVAACELRSWTFDNLLASQEAFTPYVYYSEDSSYLDLSGGYHAYVEERRQSRSKRFAAALQAQRKLEREIGPLRFDPRVTDPGMLDLLLKWKSDQHAERGRINLFGFDWTRNLLNHILATPSDEFAAWLSVLYAGQEPVAMTYDLVAGSTADGWLMAYNREFSEYSPGNVALLQNASALADAGIKRLDLGRGGGDQKRAFASGVTLLAEGAVESRPLRDALRRRWIQTREWIRGSSLRVPARTVRDWLQPLEARLLDISPSENRAEREDCHT